MPQMVMDTLGLGRSGLYWDVLTISMKERPKQYPMFVSEANTNQSFERIFSVTGFGYPQYTDEGGPIPNDIRRQLYSQDFTPALYGISYNWTDKAEFTDRYGKFAENPKLAAKSMIQGRELMAANLFNNGFSSSYVGADTVALFSTAHLTNGGASWSNRPSSALALGTAALKQAKSEMRRVKDPRNLPMAFTGATKLWIPPELEVTADILLNSTEIPFTTDRGSNKYNSRITDFMVIDELTSTTAWGLMAADKSETSLFLLYGMPLSVESQRTAITKTTVYCTSEERTSGWKTAYGLWGTPGA